MRIDDNWCESALAVLEGVKANGLITSLNRTYSYDDVNGFDFIASATTGTDHIQSGDIPLLSLKGEPGLKEVYATAEMTIGLILALVRRIPFAFDDVKQGNWNRDAWQGSELHGRTLGIVGYGRVGQQVARIAKGFGMRVRFNDIKVDMRKPNRSHPLPLKTLLYSADIITVHVPLNDTTRGMFGCEQFAMMKPTAYFINTSRGAVVDEDALLRALSEQRIAGAALDVIDGEPEISLSLRAFLNDDYNNLIVSPHCGGNTAESRERTQRMLAEKIRDYVHSHYRPTEEHYPSAGVCDGVI